MIRIGTDQADQIFASYRQTLETVTEQLAFGVSETLLAHRREEIREAIRHLACRVSAGGCLDPVINREALRAAYQSLASFVSYEDAHAAASLHHALERGDYAFLASPAAETANRISHRIEQESKILAREFDVIRHEPVDPLLAEVEAFLVQFDRKPAQPAD